MPRIEEEATSEVGAVPRRIIVVGEVLIDELPDGREAVGGAPMNVAWNLRGLGQHPHLVSAVGSDESGKYILSKAEEWGLSTADVQIDADRPTGRVKVTHDRGEPKYEIPTDQAFDFIRYPQGFADSFTAAERPILYHGSLCGRSSVSFDTILQLRRRFDSDIVVDINLREGHYTHDLVDQIVHGASVIKCNLDELRFLTDRATIRDHELAEAARSVVIKYGVREIWVTRGDRGAFWMDESGNHLHSDSSDPQLQIVDTVGAGDAFMASILHGLAVNHTRAESLRNGVQLAARICSIAGPTPTTSDVYDDLFQTTVSE